MAKSKARGLFVWIILGLLIVGLMGFGASGLSGNIRSVGSVGDKDISVESYARQISQQIRAFEAQTGNRMTFAQMQAFGLDQQVLSQLVTERTLDNAAANLGISVGDERVRDEVLKIQSFQGLDGVFSRDSYTLALEQNNLTEAEFELGLREEMARTLLQGAVVAGVPEPTGYSNTLALYLGETRDFTLVRVDAAALSAPLAEPTEAALTAEYEANPDAYTLPEQREISYIWLTPEMIQDDVVVDEAQLQEAYDLREAEFNQAERRLVERLIFPDVETANAALAGINEGLSFDTIVADRGLDLADIDLGDVAVGDLGAAGEAVFASVAGDIIGPIDTDLGPALFRMNAVLAAQITTFEQAIPELREEIAASRARRMIEEQQESIIDLMAGGATLEDIAERTDLELDSLSWNAEARDGIAAYEEFRAAAAGVEEGAFPDLLSFETGGIFALRLDALTPPVVQPMADVRAAVITAWEASATQAAVLAMANEINDGLDAEADLSALGLTSEIFTAETRRGFIDGTPPIFLSRVFELEIGESTVIEEARGSLIVRLDGVAGADLSTEQNTAQLEAISETVRDGISQDLFEAFANQLQLETDINLDQTALNAVNASFTQ